MTPSRKSPRESQETTISNPLEQAPDDTAEEQLPQGKTYSKITVNTVEDEILGRARGFIAKVNMEGPIEGIDDMSGLITEALKHYIPKLEKKHNDGEPFRAPRRLPRGRKSTK